MMQEFLQHVMSCPTGGIGKGCSQCKRIVNLFNLHARVCRNDNCGVPRCKDIRERLRYNNHVAECHIISSFFHIHMTFTLCREMSMRQQEMDDRRRIQMNSMYSSHASQNSQANAEEG